MRYSIRKRSTKSRKHLCAENTYTFGNSSYKNRTGKAGLAGGADTLNPNVTDGVFSGNAVTYAACYGIYVYTLHHCNKIPSLKKNQHKTITRIICKTEYRENSRFCRSAGNKTNSAGKLGT